jgi:eukaryotic-like serine/threonine-protein kinase
MGIGRPGHGGLLAQGTTFGHYQIVRHLGSGGMGSVYEAVHSNLGKRVAIKTLLPQYAAHPEAQARFLREGKLAARLSHPHVVDVTDFGIEEGVPYLVMAYLEGEDLGAMLEREGRLFPNQIADLMLPITAALASAHDQQIVHRDLKPQNIFLARTASGEANPKVLDFGISKLLNDPDAGQLTGSMNLLGTPAYMSPEQARSGKYVDARSDQYTLAVILYECVTGRLPFAADGVYELIRVVVEGAFRPPSEVVPGVPKDFEAIILRGMKKDPDERFPSTWELGSALLPFASPRNQVLWEADFRGNTSTLIGKAGGRKPQNPSSRPVTTPGLDELPQHPDLARPDPQAESPAQEATTRPEIPNQAQPSPVSASSGPASEDASDRAVAQGDVEAGHDRPVFQSLIEQAIGTLPTRLQATAAPPEVAAHQRPASPSPAPMPSTLSLAEPPPRSMRGVIIVALVSIGLGFLGVWFIASAWPFTSAGHPPATATISEPPSTPKVSVPAPPAVPRPSPPSNPVPTFVADLAASPELARLELDGKPVGTGRYSVTLPKDGVRHTLRISLEGYLPQMVEFRDAPPPQQVALEHVPKTSPMLAPAARASSSEMGTVQIVARAKNKTQWANIAIDGQRNKHTAPLTVQLAPGRHRIQASRDGLGTSEKIITVRASETMMVTLDLDP